MTLTASECHDCHLFVLCIEQRFASQKTQVQWLWKIACVLFAIPMVKGHPFYWDSNLRDQKKEQCDSIMGRSQISESFERLCSEVFSLISVKMSQVLDRQKMAPQAVVL